MQLKPRNAVNFSEFIFTVHNQTEKCAEMTSTSYGGNIPQFSLAAHDFAVSLHTFPSIWTSTMSILKGGVGFPQIALIKLMWVPFSLTF